MYTLKMIQHSLPGHGKLTPWGIMVHTTGGSIPDEAYATGKTPLEVTIAKYAKMAAADGVGPHYAIVPDGTVVQFRQTNELAYHVGVSPAERRDFLSGHWESLAARGVVGWWKARWPGKLSPQHLYPSTSPNHDYVGIELVPCTAYVKGNSGSLRPVFGDPVGGERGRFTAAQYVSLALLTLDIAGRHGIPLQGARLLGHEDVNPLSRPGWDPGDMQGYFSWSLLRGIIDGLKLHNVTVTQQEANP